MKEKIQLDYLMKSISILSQILELTSIESEPFQKLKPMLNHQLSKKDLSLHPIWHTGIEKGNIKNNKIKVIHL